MKSYQKFLLSFTLLCTLSLCFITCSIDDKIEINGIESDDLQEKHEDTKGGEISYSESNLNKLSFHLSQKLRSNIKNISKGTERSQSSFEIDTSLVSIIEYKTFSSYTFPVKINSGDHNLYNIIYSFYGSDSSSTQLANYYLNTEITGDENIEVIKSRITHFEISSITDEEIELNKSPQNRTGGCSIWGYFDNVLKCEGELRPGPDCFESDGSPIEVTIFVVAFTACDTGGGGSVGPDGDNTGHNGWNEEGEPDGGGPGGGGSSSGNNSNTNTNPNCIADQNGDCVSTMTTPVFPRGDPPTTDAILINNINALLDTPLTEEQEEWILENENALNGIRSYIENECEDGNCPIEVIDNITEYITILEEVPEALLERLVEIKALITEDPFALLQDCFEQSGLDTSNYLDLYNLPFPEACTTKLHNTVGVGPHQPITDGNVPLANIDYYGVEITTTPDFDDDGISDTEAEIYQAFRNNFIPLGSGEIQDFQFSCDLDFNGVINSDDTGDISWEFVPVTTQDGIDFVSNNPITSVLLIEAGASGLGALAADDGAVIVTHFTPNDWTIATIFTDNNGSQPFSGNRQWGWFINQNGNFEFFTRAVDVANISILLNAAPGTNTECQQDSYYNVAEATWQNMQEELVQLITENGGQASISPNTTAVRVDREKIKELLTSNETIDQINCN